MSQATVRAYFALLGAGYGAPTPGDVCAPFYRVNPVGSSLLVKKEVQPVNPKEETFHVCREVL